MTIVYMDVFEYFDRNRRHFIGRQRTILRGVSIASNNNHLLLGRALISYYDRNRNLLVSFVSHQLRDFHERQRLPNRSHFKEDGSARHPNEPFSVRSSGNRRVHNPIQVNCCRLIPFRTLTNPVSR
jgi:hypothetical protein